MPGNARDVIPGTKTTFIICPSDYNQKLQVEARKAKIQQMYELSLSGLDLKLLFMVTGACYESGPWKLV